MIRRRPYRAFKMKPYDAPRCPRTPAQETQQRRAFHIFRLRGLWNLAYILPLKSRTLVQAIIDIELERLGAEGEARKRVRLRREALEESEMPF